MHYENDYFEESPMQSYIPSLVSLSFLNLSDVFWDWVPYSTTNSGLVFFACLKMHYGNSYFEESPIQSLIQAISSLCLLNLSDVWWDWILTVTYAISEWNQTFFVIFKTLMHDGNEHFEALLTQSQNEA